MAKKKTITVYELGDIVHCSFNEKTYKITDVWNDSEYEGVNINDSYDEDFLAANNLRLLTKKELKTLEDSTLIVGTLDETIYLRSDHVEVGCQRISLADAKKIGEFLSKIKLPKAKKKATKKKKANLNKYF